MAEWQPIATAPKDRQIMLFCPRFGIQAPGEWRDAQHFGQRAGRQAVRPDRDQQPEHRQAGFVGDGGERADHLYCLHCFHHFIVS